MKKLLFGLIATVMLGFTGNAQSYTKEKVQDDLTIGCISFYNSIKEYYIQGMSEEDFYQRIYVGQINNRQTDNAKNLLATSFNLLSRNSSDREVLNKLFKPFTLFTYDGLKLIEKGTVSDLTTASTLMFGVNDDNFNSKLSPTSKGPNGDIVLVDNLGCRWYQLGCHIRWLFGTKDGRETLKSIIEFAALIIKVF